jgi:hypothetical protein
MTGRDIWLDRLACARACGVTRATRSSRCTCEHRCYPGYVPRMLRLQGAVMKSTHATLLDNVGCLQCRTRWCMEPGPAWAREGIPRQTCRKVAVIWGCSTGQVGQPEGQLHRHAWQGTLRVTQQPAQMACLNSSNVPLSSKLNIINSGGKCCHRSKRACSVRQLTQRCSTTRSRDCGERLQEAATHQQALWPGLALGLLGWNACCNSMLEGAINCAGHATACTWPEVSRDLGLLHHRFGT